MRSESPRDAWADIRHFLDRAAKPVQRSGKYIGITARRWSSESASGQPASGFGEWPSECSIADFDAAVRLASERFGRPRHKSKTRDGFEVEQVWFVPVERADDVLDFLDLVPTCTDGSEWAPVHASYWCLFHLRNLTTGRTMPRQGGRLYPRQSTLSATLQRRSRAGLAIVLPFGEPDAAVADYVVALQEHAPVWLDPRYFDHFTPKPDGEQFHRRRLPSQWIGETGGELRLDTARSGIAPLEESQPTDAEMAADATQDDAQFQANYVAVANALREHRMTTLVIRGPRESGKRYMVEQAAAWLDMPLHVIRTDRDATSLSFADELRAIISAWDGRPALLLIDVSHWTPETNAEVLAQMAGRVLLGVEIPAGMRLVVAEDTAPGDASGAAIARAHVARDEGFATPQQLEFLRRQAQRAAWREVAVELLPP